ncbi:MAG: glycosyltransferase [Candidatus Electrothrix sp. GM3_4]|nr:glycosyltransferase [Candidatus Electrothrix sp. GM3_4]
MSKQFFHAMNKELTFDMIKKNLNIVRKLLQLIQQDDAPAKKRSSKTVESIKLLGVRVDLLTENKLHQYISNVIERKSKKLVLNVNVHCYNMIFKNPWMQKFFNKAEVIFCDGSGVALGAKILGLRMPTRFTPADSIWNLAALAEKKGHSFYFLGAKDGIAEKAAQKMKKRYPNLKITTHHGYFNKSRNSVENQEIVAKINASKANILVVGFGMPIQEKWLQENWDQLNVNIGFSAGALFDYVSGELRRGPRWMTENGLEWLARMLIEPKRLWKRYLLGNTLFLFRVFMERLKNIMKDLLWQFKQGLEVLMGAIFPISQPVVAQENKKLDVIFHGTGIRKYPRMELRGYTAQIINENSSSYTATIRDASLGGLQVQGLPAKFNANKEGPLTIIVSNLLDSIHYKLIVQPKWGKKKDSSLAAGFSIVKAPTEWNEFMLQTA